MEAENGDRSEGPQILNARDVAADFQYGASHAWNAIADAWPAGFSDRMRRKAETHAERLGGHGGPNVTAATIPLKVDDFPPVS
ncbi:hypothetical protein RHSP_15153 [Rhizobium freirei PRF 81]|uniref:Uncharacterized protein n=1 Tax=Rhizobium freirei PRF 81 TaxID=363754 RepID=N6UZ13_9HYPH|nr:hypothetical protein RHSP_15153 [Rhizobium freirei PRF 81]